MGKPGEAVALLEPLEKANPENLDLAYILGTAMVGVGRHHDGISRIEKVAQATSSADAYAVAGETLLRLNEYEAAQKDLEAAVRLNPKLPGVYTMLGTNQDKLGHVQDAEQSFREALKVDANDVDANVYLGTLLYKRGALDEGKSYLDRALRLNPSSLLARYEMAMWESTDGKFQAAIERLEAVVKDKPDWLDPHVQLASLYYRLHRPEDGLRERKIVERITAEQQAAGPPKQ